MFKLFFQALRKFKTVHLTKKILNSFKKSLATEFFHFRAGGIII